MTEIEYKIVVKLMVEKLERLKDEIAEKDAEIKWLKEELNATIAGQETLQKYIAEQQEKIIKLEAETMKPIIHNAVLGAELGEEIKVKAIKEFAERLKPMYKVLCVDEGDWCNEIDNLVKEMVGGNGA